VKTVNPKYTSQIDHNTGRRDGCERKGRRFYGKKGRILDADVNAAINIASKVAKKSANSSPKHPILCCKALDGQVEVVDLSTASQPTNRGALALQASSFRGEVVDELCLFYNNTCQICLEKFPRSQLTIEHVRPKSKSGTDFTENKTITCKKCNSKKASHFPYYDKNNKQLKGTKIPQNFLLVEDSTMRNEWRDFIWHK